MSLSMLSSRRINNKLCLLLCSNLQSSTVSFPCPTHLLLLDIYDKVLIFFNDFINHGECTSHALKHACLSHSIRLSGNSVNDANLFSNSLKIKHKAEHKALKRHRFVSSFDAAIEIKKEHQRTTKHFVKNTKRFMKFWLCENILCSFPGEENNRKNVLKQNKLNQQSEP